MANIFPQTIPAAVRRDKKRKAECKVFDALKKSLDNNFHVFYSTWWFNLKGKQQDGEADFIVAHKDLGIIFIEVKGGAVRRDDQGNWYSGRNEIKDPINQAMVSKKVIHKAFQKRYEWHHGSRSKPYIYLGHFAFLPETSRPQKTYLGLYNIEQFGFLDDMQNIAKKINAFFDYRPPDTHRFPAFDSLGNEGINVIKEIITMEFDWTNSLKTQIELNNYEIRELTKEQSNFERQHSEFKRLWVEGPAGSGKTSLAFRKLISTEGEKTRNKKAFFLCRNRMLADNISKQLQRKIDIEVDGFNVDYKCSTFDQFIYDISGIKTLKNHQKVLSSALDECLDKNIKYDLVIIDEAQDFEENWWMIIEAIIHDESILWIFGDANQRIWDTKKPDIEGIDYSVKLFDVIRNTEQIGNFGLTFYEGRKEDIIIKGPQGHQIEIVPSFNCEEDILKKISYLHSYECVVENQIAIVHQKSLAKSKIQNLINIKPTKKHNFSFTDDFNLWEDKILISSIYKFKGMESDVVILYLDDISKLSEEEIYVGVTRAKSHLLIFCENAIQSAIEKRLEILL